MGPVGTVSSVSAAAVASVLALEEVAARGWPAPHTALLGRWLLRAGDGWTRRANSTLVLGDPGVPLDDAVQHVIRWYRDHGLPAAFSVPLPPQRTVDEYLAGLGWRLELDTYVLVADLPLTVRHAAAATPTNSRHTAGGLPLTGHHADDGVPTSSHHASSGVRLAKHPPPGWDAVYRGAAPLPASALPILTGPPDVTFAAVTDADDRVIATGRGVLTDGWLGLAAIEVTPSHRGRGLARQVTHALLRWGADRGAARCYLQVASDNTPALTLYTDLGFAHHHVYRQRIPPA